MGNSSNWVTTSFWDLCSYTRKIMSRSSFHLSQYMHRYTNLSVWGCPCGRTMCYLISYIYCNLQLLISLSVMRSRLMLHKIQNCIIWSQILNRPVGFGGSGGSDEALSPPPSRGEGPHCLERSLGGLLTNNLTGLKHVSHVEKKYWNLSCENETLVLQMWRLWKGKNRR